MADIILPAAHWTERDDIEDLMMKNWVFAQIKAVEPIPDCWSEPRMLIELAKKMGLNDYWKSTEEHFNYRLEPLGMTFEEFKKVGKFSGPVVEKAHVNRGGFPSPSGKIELYGKVFQPFGVDPLPIYREPPESPMSSPELYKDYPLVLTTGGRNIVYYHSSLRNIPSLHKKSPDPELQIHPKTAGEYSIKDGEWIYLASPRGRIEIKVKYFDDIHPKVVHAPHGYWYGVENGWKRLNINILTDSEQTDPVSASCPLRGFLCRIEKM
jgi:anaerobic selenocysteine-containing dehydrogenase